MQVYPIPDFAKYFSFDDGILHCIKDDWKVIEEPIMFRKELYVWAIYAGPHCLSRYSKHEQEMAEQIVNAHNGNKLIGMTDDDYNTSINMADDKR